MKYNFNIISVVIILILSILVLNSNFYISSDNDKLNNDQHDIEFLGKNFTTIKINQNGYAENILKGKIIEGYRRQNTLKVIDSQLYSFKN